MSFKNKVYYPLCRFYYNYLSWKEWKHSLFTPSNKLKIRNCPRTYASRDDVMFHANFTILCDCIEKELGGAQKMIADLMEENDRRSLMSPEDLHYSLQNQKEQEELLRLYNWYNSVDWNYPIKESEELKEARKRVSIKHVPEETEPNSDVKVYILEQVGSPADIMEFNQAIKNQHIAKTEFNKLCQENLLKLVSIRNLLWI